MTFFRVSFGIVGRANGGSAKRRSAYQRCTSLDEFDFSDKAHELQHAEVMLPETAPDHFRDPGKLWTAAEAAENRCDAQLSRTLEIAIPHEVHEELRNDFAREMLSFLVEDHGFAVEWSRHKAEHLFEQGDTMNDHIHAQISMRKVTETGFDAKKDRDFNILMKIRNGRTMREFLENRMNTFFDKHGIKAEVSAKPIPEELKVPEIPLKNIQEIKRKKNRNDKKIDANTLSPNAKKAIVGRHRKKHALKELREAEHELASAKNNGRKEEISEEKARISGDRRNDERADQTRHSGSVEEAKPDARIPDRNSGSPRPSPTPERREQPTHSGTASSGRVGSDPSNGREASTHGRTASAAAGNLRAGLRQVRTGKLNMAASRSAGFHDAIRDAGSGPPQDWPNIGDYKDAAAFLRAWSATYKPSGPRI